MCARVRAHVCVCVLARARVCVCVCVCVAGYRRTTMLLFEQTPVENVIETGICIIFLCI